MSASALSVVPSNVLVRIGNDWLVRAIFAREDAPVIVTLHYPVSEARSEGLDRLLGRELIDYGYRGIYQVNYDRLPKDEPIGRLRDCRAVLTYLARTEPISQSLEPAPPPKSAQGSANALESRRLGEALEKGMGSSVSGAGIMYLGEPDANGEVPLVTPIGVTIKDWTAFLWRHEVFRRAWLSDPPLPMWNVRTTTVPGWIGALVHWANLESLKSPVHHREPYSCFRLVKRAIRVAKQNHELARALDSTWRVGGYLAAAAFLQAQNFDRPPNRDEAPL